MNQPQPEPVRLDKWLWATRVFKTRQLAMDACRAGQITILGQEVKPSREVRPGMIIQARIGPLNRTIRVLDVTEARMSAKMTPQFLEDLTPAAEYERVRLLAQAPTLRPPTGMGRPTKKQRRSIEKVMLGMAAAED